MRKYLGPVLWSFALILLFFMDTEGQSLCFFTFAGFTPCPGCGLGHGIHHALHLRFAESLSEHILAIPAIFAMLYNIIKPLLTIKPTNNGSTTLHDAAGTST
jgi:hypothetical protein